MDSVYFCFSVFISLYFVVGGRCLPLSPYVYRYEATESWDAMEIPPINFEEVSNEPWNVDEYTAWTYVSDWSSTTASTTIIAKDETKTLIKRTTTPIAVAHDGTRALKVTGIRVSTTTDGTVFREVIKALNKVTPTATSSTVIRNEIRVLNKVAQILILLGEKVIPHVVGDPSVFESSCKQKT